jgi:hypothetical protein
MPMPLSLLRQLQSEEPVTAWATLFGYGWSVCSTPLQIETAPSEVVRRDAEIGAADLFLATAGWDLWRSFETAVPRTSDALASWWAARASGRAVLILDAMSLREVPWLLQGAAQRGYAVHQQRATGAELPADTTPFAKSLGFISRGSIQNNGGAATGRLSGATTDSTDLPWEDCAAQITSAHDWLLWHHWPDVRLHDLNGPGHGVASLAREAAEKLTSNSFWELVHRLTTGRRLVITADHGYAASGLFPDTVDPAQARYLKDRFKSGRWAALSDLEQPSHGAWVPPIDLHLVSAHVDGAFALGRRKWKSPGGYPTLTHGGLTLLEVAVPFIELSRTGGA